MDDGSTDSLTIAALERVEAGPARVIRQENRGLSSARNRGIEVASGDYILPLDHDDEIYPTYVAQAAAVLDKKPSVGIVYARAERFGASSGEWILPDFTMGGMLTGNLIHASALFRREDWCTVGGYSTDLRRGYEDHDFWLKLLTLGRDVVRLDEVLFRYRDTEGSMVKAMTRQDRVDAFAHTFATNSELYVRNADRFAEAVVGQWDTLAHFKRRYGRFENVVARVGGLRRQLRGRR